MTSLLIVTGVLAGARITEAELVADSWRTRVNFDFSDGITGEIWDRDRQVQLKESATEGGALVQMPHGDDWAVHFPMTCDLSPQKCPRAILESNTAELLNPGDRPARWGASVQIMPNERADGANVLQKGLSAAGTQFKLQVDGLDGRPSCVISGGEWIYVALSRQGIADGEWHRLACERAGMTLSLSVDGTVVASETVPPDVSIVNEHPLRIGGKGHGPYNDQFHGTVDDVFVYIG